MGRSRGISCVAANAPLSQPITMPIAGIAKTFRRMGVSVCGMPVPRVSVAPAPR